MTREEYITALFSTYDLVSVLSDKNDCKVLRLRHKQLGRDLVLHSFPAPVAAYEQLTKIECENLPTIYDTALLDDGQVVLEEFIDGITVSQVMESGTYHYSGIRTVVRAVCNALYVLHSLGIVHRDVKPENIMIDKNARVVLIDFNVSRKVSDASRDTVIMGTVGYASPEQLGISQTDARTDIYAVGVLLNVMLTGKHPSEQMARGRAGRIVRKCTAVSPKDRYQTAKKLFAAL
ncbi:MAG: serine/threonine protein kinase [Oscillospiraceae bacterium]|nr:serine/threonine protein kinase [Oscillospiraceae bacterium]